MLRAEEAKLQDKLALFGALQPGEHAVINIDDPNAPAFLRAAAHAEPMTFSMSNTQAKVHCLKRRHSLSGTTMLVRTPAGAVTFTSPLLGSLQAQSIVAAIAAAVAVDVPLDVMADALEQCPVRALAALVAMRFALACCCTAWRGCGSCCMCNALVLICIPSFVHICLEHQRTHVDLRRLGAECRRCRLRVVCAGM